MVANLENPLAAIPGVPIRRTPIHLAVSLGQTEIFKFLASKVEDPNAQKKFLKLAFQYGRWEIFKILLPSVLQNASEKCHTSDFEVISNNLDL